MAFPHSGSKTSGKGVFHLIHEVHDAIKVSAGRPVCGRTCLLIHFWIRDGMLHRTTSVSPIVTFFRIAREFTKIYALYS